MKLYTVCLFRTTPKITVTTKTTSTCQCRFFKNLTDEKTRPDTRPPDADGWAGAFSHFSIRA